MDVIKAFRGKFRKLSDIEAFMIQIKMQDRRKSDKEIYYRIHHIDRSAARGYTAAEIRRGYEYLAEKDEGIEKEEKIYLSSMATKKVLNNKIEIRYYDDKSNENILYFPRQLTVDFIKSLINKGLRPEQTRPAPYAYTHNEGKCSICGRWVRRGHKMKTKFELPYSLYDLPIIERCKDCVDGMDELWNSYNKYWCFETGKIVSAEDNPKTIAQRRIQKHFEGEKYKKLENEWGIAL